MSLLIWLLILFILVWAFERFFLRGGKVPDYPAPANSEAVRRFPQTGGLSPGHEQAVKTVRELTTKIAHKLVQGDKGDLTLTGSGQSYSYVKK